MPWRAAGKKEKETRSIQMGGQANPTDLPSPPDQLGPVSVPIPVERNRQASPLPQHRRGSGSGHVVPIPSFHVFMGTVLEANLHPLYAGV